MIERLLPAVAVTLGVTLFLGGGVARRDSSAVDRKAAPAVAAEAAPRGADTPSALPGGSLYDLGLKVVGTDGRMRPLDDWRGHPVLASMFFASCPTACPLLINDLQRLEAALPADLRDETRVLLVSFDPKRDSPAVLEGVVASAASTVGAGASSPPRTRTARACSRRRSGSATARRRGGCSIIRCGSPSSTGQVGSGRGAAT